MRLGLLKHIVAVVALIITLPLYATSSLSNRYTTKSKLASGRWVKIEVGGSGMYQISYSTLQNLGFNPSKVKIYGYGGNILPEDFTKPYIDDLPEIPVLRHNSRIIFYGEGTVSWTAENGTFTHKQNPYSSKSYYFISQTEEDDIEMESIEDNLSGNSSIVTTFDDYALYENELCNVGNMGRNLYGEDFIFKTIQNFNFNISGIIGDVNMRIDFIAKLQESGALSIKHNGKNLTNGERNIKAFNNSDDWYYTAAKLTTINKTFTPSPNSADVITLQFSASDPKLARLDFIKLQMERTLKLYGSAVKFRKFDAKSTLVRYKISTTGYSAVNIWDITESHNPKKINATKENNALLFTPNNTGIREYIAFDANATFSEPTIVGDVANQNLHGLERADLVIIAPQEFYQQAKRLAEFHRDNDQLSSLIVRPELIYNEFASGKADATAYRRFMKMFYDRAESLGDKALYPRYLLLFGDGSCDNRHITSEWQGYNYPFLLTFQSESSIDERNSYVTDDYFAFLKDSDGRNLLADKPAIGVGRFPVRTVSEATTAVDKVINYSKNSNYGIWKNELCFIADDGNHSGHMELAEDLIKIVKKNNPEFLSNKLYIDAYNKVGGSSGGTYPDAKREMMNYFENGQLIVNYAGHGSATSWTKEKLLTIQDIKKLYLEKLPFFITATCDFSRFDAPTTSAGEEMFLNSKGGGIGLISTTRVVYMDKNETFNKEFISHLFNRDENGNRYRIGDVVKLSKSAVTEHYGQDLNKLNFILLADPALKLAFPEYKIKITEINGEKITGNPYDIVLKARSQVTFKGEILNPLGEKDETFNGYIQQRLYDSEREIVTHGNDEGGEPYTFKVRDSKLYEGKDIVKNGEFEFTFKLPKELNYSSDPALMNLYAYDEVQKVEAQGTSEEFIINGYDAEAEADTEGPIIEKFYLNDSGFIYGATINETPVIFVDVYDKSGINVSGIGLGHDFTIKIDNNSDLEYVVNNYFTPTAGEFGRGTLMYQIPELTEGEHTLTIKVWDTEGNSSEKSTMFIVEKGLEPEIFQLYTTQNPVRESAKFYLKHDRPNMIMQVTIAIYDLWGNLLWSRTNEGKSDMWTAEPVVWDLNDAAGKRVQPGIYIYKAYISTETGRSATDAKKIAVLAQ
ncbi:MAG: type IX secretion system sortase PorU [Bacteroidales bacterium]|nr:type IX secretion system sortase PorU [Bacteroidales bacterium]